jgi:hypothetical protein
MHDISALPSDVRDAYAAIGPQITRLEKRGHNVITRPAANDRNATVELEALRLFDEQIASFRGLLTDLDDTLAACAREGRDDLARSSVEGLTALITTHDQLVSALDLARGRHGKGRN